MNKIRIILILAILMSAITLTGCSKSSGSNPAAIKLSILRSHVWSLDYGKVTESGVTEIISLPTGAYQHVKYNDDNTCVVMSSDGPDQTYTYEFIPPDVLNSSGSGVATIKELTDQLLHVLKKDPASDKVVEYYYRAE